MKVLGEVVLDADCAALRHAVVYVYLEDVSRADAAAERIATLELTGIDHRPGQEDRIPFELEAAAAGPHATLILRAHVSPHGGEDVQSGDYLTMEHISADPRRPGERVPVRVRRVG